MLLDGLKPRFWEIQTCLISNQPCCVSRCISSSFQVPPTTSRSVRASSICQETTSTTLSQNSCSVVFLNSTAKPTVGSDAQLLLVRVVYEFQVKMSIKPSWGAQHNSLFMNVYETEVVPSLAKTALRLNVNELPSHCDVQAIGHRPSTEDPLLAANWGESGWERYRTEDSQKARLERYYSATIVGLSQKKNNKLVNFGTLSGEHLWVIFHTNAGGICRGSLVSNTCFFKQAQMLAKVSG